MSVIPDPDISVLTREQKNRLCDIRAMAEQVERYELADQLARQLRRRRYANRWIKPFDLWSEGAQLIASSAVAALIVTGGLAVLC
ncbi:hypothetical protein U4960_04310 [Altererythrobacter sp. H2]|uniref:hypothetical protein n=1 Tax=Altererythrobacter sp. H2 TaxID=3108391 RepID=UPI002B4BC6F5|nr:hypothetical protein [Altererythrobacter sp. H2]WRK96554.1 hypothetical protein U4960_04310 [Altererythrobacter sp. H2]